MSDDEKDDKAEQAEAAPADDTGTEEASDASDTATDVTAIDDDEVATDSEPTAGTSKLRLLKRKGSSQPKAAKRPARSGGNGSKAGVIVAAALTAVLVLSTAFSTWAYLALYRPNQSTNDKVAATVLKAATDGTVALLSYSPESLEGDFTNAKTHLTGDFLNYYTDFTQKIVTPAAKDKQVKTSAAVVRSALSQLQSSSAEVLLFINQATTSKENPDGTFTASSVKVGMKKIDDNWLISAFDPV